MRTASPWFLLHILRDLYLIFVLFGFKLNKQFSHLKLTYAVILSQIWKESDHWARSYRFLKMEAFDEKSQTYFRKFSYRKINENRKFQNFNFFDENQIFGIFNFHWLFDRKIFENNFVIFHQKLPSSSIDIFELSHRIPFEFGLKWPHKVALGGKIVYLIKNWTGKKLNPNH